MRSFRPWAKMSFCLMKVLVVPYPLEARPTEELEQIARDYYPKVLELLGVTE